MLYTNNNNFKRVCLFVLFTFYLQILQPAAFGYQNPTFTRAPTSKHTGQQNSFLDWLIPAAHAADEPVDPLLASTPDADITDPFIIEKAAELGNDPEQIFAFVRDEIAFESYVGSLRGARGTLWSKAGNALDQARLLIALLRVSGVPSQYVQGTLPDDKRVNLITSMFDFPSNIVGCPTTDAILSDPANDPELFAETEQHFWVEFFIGNESFLADTSFQETPIGEVFGQKSLDFTEIPNNLRHKLTLRLKTEFPGGLVGSFFDIRTPINKTFYSVELVGKPLTIGHFINTQNSGGLLFSSISHNYSPYLIVGQSNLNIADTHVIRGEDYQEFFSSFPFAQKVLTGLFLEIDVISPSGQVETFKRTILDRIGFDKRQNGGSVSFDASAAEQPAFSEMDLVTINALPGLQPVESILQFQDQLESLQQKMELLQPQISSIPAGDSLSNEEIEIIKQAKEQSKEAAILSSRIIAMAFSNTSDVFVAQMEKGYLTKAYYDSPRLTIVQTNATDEQLGFKLDLRKNNSLLSKICGSLAE